LNAKNISRRLILGVDVFWDEPLGAPASSAFGKQMHEQVKLVAVKW